MGRRSYVQLVRKSNELVSAKYKFDIWETRVFTKIITMIHKDDDDFKNYRVYLSDMVKDFGLDNNKESYEWLKRGARGLLSKIITIVREENGIQMELETPLAIGVDKPLEFHAQDELRFIDISFHPKMKPLLLQLQGRFTTYDVRNIVQLPSTYSIRMYELLKQYEKIKYRKIDLEELKEMVGVVERVQGKSNKIEVVDYYPLFGNFRQRVLLKAQKDLKEQTDISFTFETIKKGRKVTAVEFFISKNNPKRNSAMNKAKDSSKAVSIYQAIVPFTEKWETKPSKDLIDDLVNSGYTQVDILQAIKYTDDAIQNSKKPIKNIIGYLRKMVEEASAQGNLFKDAEKEKEKVKNNKKAESEREIKRQHLKDTISGLRKQKDEIFQSVTATLLEKTPTLFEDIVNERRESIANTYKHDKTLEENLESPVVRAFLNNSLIRKYSKEYKDIIPVDEEIEKMTNQLAGI